MQGHQGQTQKRLGSRIYHFTTPGCVALPGSDVGSNDVQPALGFVIKNHQTSFFISCPMQAVGHAVAMTPHSQSGKEREPLVLGQMVFQRQTEPPSCPGAVALSNCRFATANDFKQFVVNLLRFPAFVLTPSFSLSLSLSYLNFVLA